MKRILIIVVIILASFFVLSGCANKDIQGNEGNNLPKSDTNNENNKEDTSDEDSETSIGELSEKSGMEVNVSLGKTGTSMSLPDSFPEDVFPLLDDANIVNVNENKDNKAIGIIFETDKSYEDTVDFYKEVVEEAKKDFEDENDTGYAAWGSKGDYSFTISINKPTHSKVGVLIDVRPK